MSKNYLSIYAKSFSWAGFFLPKKIYQKCSILYDFCRSLDDIADQDLDLDNKKKQFKEFKNKFLNKDTDDQIINHMRGLINNCEISEKIVYDLFDGVESDLKQEVKINSKKELNTKYGSGFSIQPKLSQSAYFRFHNKSEICKGLYFVGAGTHPGAGVPGVLSSAKVLDKII